MPYMPPMFGVQGGEDLGFPLKPGKAISIPGEQLGQDLNGDTTAQLGVEGAIHLGGREPFHRMGNGRKRIRSAVPSMDSRRTKNYFPRALMGRASRGNSVWESARLKISKSPVRARPAAVHSRFP